MLQDLLYVFLDGSSEDLVPTGMTAKLSSAIALEAANINDGGRPLYVVVNVDDDDDAAAGDGYTIELMHCDTTDGTYTVAMAKEVPLSEIVTGRYVWKAALPIGLKKFVKIRFTPNGNMVEPQMTIVAAAASDSAAKVAGLIRAYAAQFLPNWVVTGATDAVIFTANANGVRGGTYALNGGFTGITGTWVQTQEGTTEAKEIQTLTVTAACAVTGDIWITLNDVIYGKEAAMTGDAHFNAAIVTG